MTKEKKPRKGKQTRLPGTERHDTHPDIEEAAAKYVEARDERMSLTKREVETKAVLLATMKAHKLDKYRCDSEDLEVEIVPEGETVKVKKVAPPEDFADDGVEDAL
jgi:hypothetical protein